LIHTYWALIHRRRDTITAHPQLSQLDVPEQFTVSCRKGLDDGV
jgi:hypothetical protein